MPTSETEPNSLHFPDRFDSALTEMAPIVLAEKRWASFEEAPEGNPSRPDLTLETLRRLSRLDSFNGGIVADSVRMVNDLAASLPLGTPPESIYETARKLILMQVATQTDKRLVNRKEAEQIALMLSLPQDLSSVVEGIQAPPNASRQQPHSSLADLTGSMTPLLKDAIGGPLSATPRLDQIRTLAVQVRKLWDEKRRQLSAGDAVQLARIALALQRHTFHQCDLAVSNDERFTGRQTEKMATLITTLYGSGYGNETWLHVANDLLEMTDERWEQWINDITEMSLENIRESESLQNGTSPSIFRTFMMRGALVHELILQVRDHYHDNLDPLLFRYSSELGLSDEARNSYTSELYQAMAISPLNRHLQGVDIHPPQRNRAQSALKFLSAEDRPQGGLDAYFFGESNYPDLIRITGGKGRGLHWLRQWYPENVPAGFTLPARPAHYRLTRQDKTTLQAAIGQLEKTTGRKLGAGLQVSVRSGAAISMPGTMKTALNVSSMEEIYRQVEEIYGSWDSPIARSYRMANGIPDELGTAVHIVQMIDGTRDERSGSGIVLSFPSPENNGLKIVYGTQVRGEELVSGKHPGNDFLPTASLDQELRKAVHHLEREYGHQTGLNHAVPVEVEYTVESGKIYFLQIRRAHLTLEEEIRWYAGRVREGKMAARQAVGVLGGNHRLRQALYLKTIDASQASSHSVIANDMISSGPAFVGNIAMSEEEASRLLQQGLKTIFVLSNPDVSSVAANILKNGAAALANQGNPLSHLASLAKTVPNFTMMTGEFRIDPDFLTFPNGRVVKRGSSLTLDTLSGRIYEGILPIQEGDSPVKRDILFLLGEGE